MREGAIVFQFEDQHSAKQAYDTLQELGYKPAFGEQNGKSLVKLQIDHSDVTSALEIAQSHGGVLQESERSMTEEQVFSMAYAMDEIPIPAHVVNEDWPENYSASLSGHAPPKEDVYEAYDETLNFFEPGARA